jgi:hypothetical protein
MPINFKTIPPEVPVTKAEPVKAQLKSAAKFSEADMYSEHMMDVDSPGKKLVEKATTTPVDHLKAPITNGALSEVVLKKDHGTTHVLSDKHTDFPMKFPPHPLEKLYTINVAGKMTVNLGNYESAQIHCSLTVPATKETLDEQYEFASNWVSDKINTAVKEAKKGIV